MPWLDKVCTIRPRRKSKHPYWCYSPPPRAVTLGCQAKLAVHSVITWWGYTFRQLSVRAQRVSRALVTLARSYEDFRRDSRRDLRENRELLQQLSARAIDARNTYAVIRAPRALELVTNLGETLTTLTETSKSIENSRSYRRKLTRALGILGALCESCLEMPHLGLDTVGLPAQEDFSRALTALMRIRGCAQAPLF